MSLDTEPSWPFRLKPYGVQIKALMKAERRRGYAFFMEMGLGKTAVVLAEYVRYWNAGLVDTLVVICPNTLKPVWAEQIEKFEAPIKAVIWPTGGTAAQALIMNYEATITTRGSRFLVAVLRGSRCMLVLDESVHIKNYKARRTRMLIAASEYAPYVRILSGKPVVQGAHDLWAQLRFIGAHQGFNYFQFRNHFCKMGGYLGKQVVGVQNAEQLHHMVEAVSFRARKDQWIDLPKKIYETREIELTTRQKKHYKELQDDLYTMVQNNEVVATMMMTAEIKMQQITSGFVLVGGKAVEIEGGNPKLAALLELSDELDGKFIVFCYFRHSVQMIYEGLTKRGVRAAMFMGGMQNATSAIKNFNVDPGLTALVVQIQSGKYGHTMLGTANQVCSTTVFYENSYSLDDRSQAEDRNHRIGQTLPVVYIDFVASSIDRDIIKALQKKEDVSLAVIDNIKRG